MESPGTTRLSGPLRRQGRLTGRLMALAVAPAALVAACGGGGDPKPTPTPEATATPAGPVEKTAGDILDENKTSVVKI